MHAHAVESKSEGKTPSRGHAPASTPEHAADSMPGPAPESCACGGGCPRCAAEMPIQTKLEINQPGDEFEQEADRVVDQVMRISDADLAHTDDDELEHGD